VVRSGTAFDVRESGRREVRLGYWGVGCPFAIVSCRNQVAQYSFRSAIARTVAR
jgi:hypothetical protein